MKSFPWGGWLFKMHSENTWSQIDCKNCKIRLNFILNNLEKGGTKRNKRYEGIKRKQYKYREKSEHRENFALIVQNYG